MDGGVDQGPWLQEGLVAKKGGLGLGWLFQVPQEGARAGGGESKGFGSGRVGVLFFESWRVDLVRFALLFGGQGRVGLAGQGLGGSKGFGSGGGRW